ncbi:unnamed protein product [Cyprideis torosa]|uniref:Uncharacterized protein n=1 Tax=Cyprideis torosa TaxID=163714 RepID=A0A7R8W8E6_9CRUS|nr:unnamed protein product [Cyprideis torosa]CAG0888495.1 unnamed protein product [Cyprideis torosa]
MSRLLSMDTGPERRLWLQVDYAPSVIAGAKEFKTFSEQRARLCDCDGGQRQRAGRAEQEATHCKGKQSKASARQKAIGKGRQWQESGKERIGKERNGSRLLVAAASLQASHMISVGDASDSVFMKAKVRPDRTGQENVSVSYAQDVPMISKSSPGIAVFFDFRPQLNSSVVEGVELVEYSQPSQQPTQHPPRPREWMWKSEEEDFHHRKRSLSELTGTGLGAGAESPCSPRPRPREFPRFAGISENSAMSPRTTNDRPPIYRVLYWNKRLKRCQAIKRFGAFGTIVRCQFPVELNHRLPQNNMFFIEFDKVPEDEAGLLKLRSIDVNGVHITKCSVSRGSPRKTEAERELAQKRKAKAETKKSLEAYKQRKISFQKENEGLVHRSVLAKEDPDMAWYEYGFEGTLASFYGKTPPELAHKFLTKKRRKRGKRPRNNVRKQEEPEGVRMFSGEEVFGRIFSDQSLHNIFRFLDFEQQLRFGEICRFCYAIQGDLMMTLREAVLRGSERNPLKRSHLERFVKGCPLLNSLTLGGCKKLSLTYSLLISRLPLLTSLCLAVDKDDLCVKRRSLSEAREWMRCVTPYGLKQIALHCPLLESVFLGSFVHERSLESFLTTAKNVKVLTFVYVGDPHQFLLRSPAVNLRELTMVVPDLVHSDNPRPRRCRMGLALVLLQSFPNLRYLVCYLYEEKRKYMCFQGCCGVLLCFSPCETSTFPPSSKIVDCKGFNFVKTIGPMK